MHISKCHLSYQYTPWTAMEKASRKAAKTLHSNTVSSSHGQMLKTIKDRFHLGCWD
jgi:hypothetical protein